MKYLIVLCIFLVGCDNESVPLMYRVHDAAKLSNGTASVCYLITTPKELTGKYCLKYMGERK